MPYEHAPKPNRTTWGEVCEESTGTIIVAGYSDYFDRRKCDPIAMVYGIAKQIDDVIFRERGAAQPALEALRELLAVTRTDPGDCKSQQHWESMTEHAQERAGAALKLVEGGE